jgi:DNA-binding transcriptional LysR family regulator
MDRLVVIVSPDHRLAQNRTVSLADLVSEPFLLRESGSGTRDAVLQGLARYGVTPNVVMEIGGAEAIKRAVWAGLGISIVSAVAVEDDVATGRLRALTLAEGSLTRPFTVVRRPADQAPRVERLFLDFLRAYLRTPVPGEPV